jgi:hypothetical protein
MDDFVLVVDRVGDYEYDPGWDRYSIGVRSSASKTHPLVHWGNGQDHAVVPTGGSVSELKKRLRAMLKACDQAPLRVVAEAVRLVECDD